MTKNGDGPKGGESEADEVTHPNGGQDVEVRKEKEDVLGGEAMEEGEEEDLGEVVGDGDAIGKAGCNLRLLLTALSSQHTS
ncbi:hypothetical protein L7F22_003616, partial [Adiantum nelumboides]|nr:hypothetical protein [Adiantum nelumboides]